jgi:hypothetical protein
MRANKINATPKTIAQKPPSKAETIEVANVMIAKNNSNKTANTNVKIGTILGRQWVIVILSSPRPTVIINVKNRVCLNPLLSRLLVILLFVRYAYLSLSSLGKHIWSLYT